MGTASFRLSGTGVPGEPRPAWGLSSPGNPGTWPGTAGREQGAEPGHLVASTPASRGTGGIWLVSAVRGGTDRTLLALPPALILGVQKVPLRASAPSARTHARTHS